MNRVIKFRAFDPNTSEMIESKPMPDFSFWKWSAYDSSTILMQFTGLTDKNGKEICEGDILSERWKAEVYKNIEGTYMVRFGVNPKSNKPNSLYEYFFGREKARTSETDCIIIGNIYENPELIK